MPGPIGFWISSEFTLGCARFVLVDFGNLSVKVKAAADDLSG